LNALTLHSPGHAKAPTWNAPLCDPRCAEAVDWCLSRHASAFTGSCRVYAPRYRQAAIAAFFMDKANGRAALDLAYGDVKRAFEHFVALAATHGRALVLASHSQGGWHLVRLLQEVCAAALSNAPVPQPCSPARPARLC
jgi:hypothetical protein